MTFVNPTLVRLSHKLPPSSRAWLARQYRDPYVKARLSYPANYRSRSAFKLVELDHKWKFLHYDDVRTVVDLGAAPGGWSQVVAGKMGWTDWDWDVPSKDTSAGAKRKQSGVLDAASAGFGLKRSKREEVKSRERGKLGDWSTVPPDKLEPLDYSRLLEEEDMAVAPRQVGRGTIIAVDLLRMEPIPGVKTLQMDFLSPSADEYISALLRETYTGAASEGESALRQESGKADVILSDMAANFTGNATADIEASITISKTVFEFVCRHLRTAESVGRKKGGVLVLKHFAHPEANKFKKAVLEPRFHSVAFEKPPSSRSESREGYWICMGWKGTC